eukprot:scaffold5064_cov115-Isochrysis_galbana.AAC.5
MSDGWESGRRPRWGARFEARTPPNSSLRLKARTRQATVASRGTHAGSRRPGEPAERSARRERYAREYGCEKTNFEQDHDEV